MEAALWNGHFGRIKRLAGITEGTFVVRANLGISLNKDDYTEERALLGILLQFYPSFNLRPVGHYIFGLSRGSGLSVISLKQWSKHGQINQSAGRINRSFVCTT